MSLVHQPPRASNVVALHPLSHKTRVGQVADPWKRLTADLVMAKARNGALEPALVEYLLAGAGLDVGEAP